MRLFAVLAASALLAAPLAAAEHVKNGDFENGKTAPWHLDPVTPAASLAVITDAAPPVGGSGVLGITVEKGRRIDVCQHVNVGPGKYKFSVYIDTTRCAPTGVVMVYLGGKAGEKYRSFGSLKTHSNDQNTKKVTVWQKFERIIDIPENGKITSVNIMLLNIRGTAMLDRISLIDYDADEQKKDQERKDKAATLKAAQAAAPQAVFLSRKYQNLFRADETPEQTFELANPADREVSVPVKFTVTDYFGRTVTRREKVFALSAKGKIGEALRYPECALPGFYCVTATWEAGGVAGTAKGSFVNAISLIASGSV